MKILMISSDQSILAVDSPARKRMRVYAALVDELNIIVSNARGAAGQEHHEGALHVYPAIGRWYGTYTRSRDVIVQRALCGSDVLVTTQDPFELGLIGLLLCKKFHVKLQVQCHVDFLNKFFLREKIINMIRTVIALQVLRRADHIRVVSQRIKQSIAQRVRGIDAQKISVLPIFVDVTAVRAAVPTNLHARFPQFKKIILFASRMTNEKQILWACRALEEFIAKHPDVGVVVVGDGPQRAAVEKFPFVRVLGWVDDVAPYLKGANLFLNTSLYEGYGRTLVQAAAAGVPTITTDVGVAPELFENEKTGVIIPVKDARRLVSAVAGILFGQILLQKPIITAETQQEYLQKYQKMWERAVDPMC